MENVPAGMLHCSREWFPRADCSTVERKAPPAMAGVQQWLSVCAFIGAPTVSGKRRGGAPALTNRSIPLVDTLVHLCHGYSTCDTASGSEARTRRKVVAGKVGAVKLENILLGVLL